ncbi:MAG: pilus assembly protein [Micavibrio sp.]|nr:MAG: pilus assembly protein [Micavibrio sp.]
MIEHIIETLKHKFRTNCSGAAAVVFALVLPALFAAVGLAVDLGQAHNLKTRLNNALDKTALAAGTLAGGESYIQETAGKFFHANYPDDRLGEIVDLQINVGDEIVTVAATAQVKNRFMSLLGKPYTEVSAEAEATKAFWNSIELALVLDITGSMAGQRIVDLRNAASALVDIVIRDSDQHHEDIYSKIALVPYSMGVNLGSYAGDVRGPVASGTCTSPGCQRFRFRNPFNQWVTFDVSNCVSERSGAFAYTDDPPSTAYVGWNYPAGNNPCPPNPVIPLTDNKDLLKSQINSFQAVGSTAGHIGTAWGWYMLSPHWGYLWPEESRPAPYDTERLYKIAVLMTDGEYNSPYCNGVISQDATAGSGSMANKINCNAPNGSSFEQAEHLCDAMKEDGILVYSIGFHIDNLAEAKAIMEHCASGPDYYYLAEDGDQLDAAFRDIARKISSLYLSR